MGAYYNPPTEVQNVGRELTPSESFATLTAQLQGDEVLFGLYDRRVFKFAGHIFSADEMEEFEQQVRDGSVLRVGFYAISKEKAETVCGPLKDQQH